MTLILAFSSCTPGPTDALNNKLVGMWRIDSVYTSHMNYRLEVEETVLFNEDLSFERYDWNWDFTCKGKFTTIESENKGLYRISFLPDASIPEKCEYHSFLIEKVESDRIVMIDSAYPEYRSTVKEAIRVIYKRKN
mgnify:FL=1